MARTLTIKEEHIKRLRDTFDVNETLKVLTHNRPIFWSWGVSSLTNISNKGLLFMVRGRYFTGKILIVLEFDDTYTVHLFDKNRGHLQQFDQVYFDDLVDVIDTRIEKKRK